MRTSIVALVAVLAAAPPAGAAPRDRQQRPNVVVLMTDDQTLESMRVMPRVQRLIGGRGTTFSESFVNYATCCPSRSTLLTGQYAHNHGVLGNLPPIGGYGRLNKRNWLPLWLQDAGYRTIHVGKFLNGYGTENDDPAEIPPGWSEWYASVDPSTYNYYGYTLNENGRLTTYGADEDPAFYGTDFYAERAAEVVRRRAPKRKPFFLSVAFLAPHSGLPRRPGDPEGIPTPEPAPRHRGRFAAEPLPLPPSFNELDVSDKPRQIQRRPLLGPVEIDAVRENYQQELESLLAVDEGVAAIMAALRRSGELRNTLLLFTSDNGFFHGEHRKENGKILPYEPVIRVPLLMRGPGVPRGESRHQLVTNADLAPTILEATGARPRRIQDGRSLFGLLEDPGVEWGRDLLLTGGRGGRFFTGLRTYRYSYVSYRNGDRELYDLAQDPHQLQSLHDDPAAAPIRRELARRLARLRRCRGRRCRAKPLVGTRLRFRRGADAGGAGCVRRGLRARVVGREAFKVVRTDFFVNGRRFRADRRAPFATRVRRSAYRPGRPIRIRARVTLRDGRLVTLDRQARACGGG